MLKLHKAAKIAGETEFVYLNKLEEVENELYIALRDPKLSKEDRINFEFLLACIQERINLVGKDNTLELLTKLTEEEE